MFIPSWRLIAAVLLGSTAAGLSRAVPLRPDLATWDEKMSSSMRALKSNQPEEAFRLCDEAVELARHFGPTDVRLARSEVQRAELYMWAKDYERAEHLFTEAIATCEHAAGPKSPELVHPLASLANFYYYVRPHYDQVAVIFERILDIVEHAEPRDDRDVIMWTRNLGSIYQQLGDFSRAEPLFQRAVALTETVQPDWLSHELITQSQFYRAWKKYDRAEQIARRALDRREAALKADARNIDRKLDLSIALDELAAVYLATHQLESAETTARRSLANVESFMEANNPDLGPRLESLADILQARGKLNEASATYQRLTKLTEAILGPESTQLADVLSKQAKVLHELNRADDAAKLESKATAIRKKLTASL